MTLNEKLDKILNALDVQGRMLETLVVEADERQEASRKAGKDVEASMAGLFEQLGQINPQMAQSFKKLFGREGGGI